MSGVVQVEVEMVVEVEVEEVVVEEVVVKEEVEVEVKMEVEEMEVEEVEMAVEEVVVMMEVEEVEVEEVEVAVEVEKVVVEEEYIPLLSSTTLFNSPHLTTPLSSSQNVFLMVSVGVAVGAAVCVIIVSVCVIIAVIIVRRRRDKNQVPTDNSIGLNAVNHSTPPTNEDKSQPADRITYASIDHFNQNPPQRVDAQGEDAVMYASVMPSSGRGRETANPADPSSLYSTVN
ncbi:uncharacterized protein LOC120019362 [Salvelinus namaycush]|uniref:Uncharacterized protein LOC120019362 n=1 Tax=Salvelinus namaycush TaxID=8040 RepID=A0A8U0P5F4_SALNM|nr:uncharacterized protein LOC120019362 [Salvelinus namaycush]